jgi:pre-rRNA-processing protein TSR4
MSPQIEEDDWSDSDGDDLDVSEIETSILLGIPDGVIEEKGDLLDPAVSRMGGYPVCFVTLASHSHNFRHDAD